MNDDDIDAEHAANARIRKKYGFDDPPPDTWRGDGMRITNSYKRAPWQMAISFAAMIGAAYLFELKYEIAIGFGLVLVSLTFAEARSYEIAMRLQRAAELLRQIRGDRRTD